MPSELRPNCFKHWKLPVCLGLTDRYKLLQGKYSATRSVVKSSINKDLADVETWLNWAEAVLEANHDRTLVGIADLEIAIRRHRVSSRPDH
jgi:hypothetical protein